MKVFIFLCGLSLAYGQIFDRLYADLMKEDHSQTIPLRSLDKGLVVEIGVALRRVKSIDTETGDAELDVWMSYRWKDRRLRWSSRAYNNITAIRVHPSKIWRPDIQLYNGESRMGNSLAILNSEGSVTHIPKTTINIRCDVTNYTDTDTVTCSVTFGSWTYDGSELDLQTSGRGFDLSSFQEDRWVLDSSELKRNVVFYSCCKDPYIDITGTLVFRDSKQKGWGWSFF